ncbi:cardiolipin synthase ClsB [Polaromonas sp.]|uniref:cardiolipin synthase ClsB n=1 Tax=Polaromonas sp. TaxID=1869339 RepID=UPI00273112B0|nr:cardiolipin synthase ClsB [Polaromonas sp.]MDP2451991.1 cardiolipin synthase ClsB [Polaromonas sp.]MDP3756071.1 cardiolipin synthase ClsB [Polaromonas sp.]
MNGRWVAGNSFTLLENGEAFFPRVFECIAAAEREVLLETFILFEDKVGQALQEALLTAARRGVQIDITIDGYGSPDLSPAFILALTQAGVRVHVFDPSPRLWGYRTNLFRRMHRKIVVVDGKRAFVGGINYSADHLADFGPEAKQDYAVEMEGPLVAEVHQFARAQLLLGQQPPGSRFAQLLKRRPAPCAAPACTPLPAAGRADALFVTRDNVEHKSDIERHYRIAIRGARRRIIIANAYFFPGYRLLRQLRQAARRGVDVRLILQGEPDMPIVKIAAGLLYHHLLAAGVKIYEYHDRPLHGKVALTDDEWSTVGSSNLDPLSLSLNLEANVIIKDRAFNQHLGEHLEQLMQNSCTQVQARDVAETGLWVSVRSFFVFHLLRRYPAWFGWLPAHTQRLTLAEKLLGRTDVDVKISHVNEGRVS